MFNLLDPGGCGCRGLEASKMSSHRRTPQGGFTLIELVVVIVILGILAAFAIPRFANIAKDARVSALNGMAGSLRSTSALVHGMALARNVTNATAASNAITLEGTGIAIVEGYPAAAADGVIAALVNLDTATYTLVPATPAAGSITVRVVGASNPAGCSVFYTQPAAPGTAGTVTVSPTLQADC
jgi:MSHA pilin protein MshA